MEPYVVEEGNAALIAQWLDTRGGIAIWKSLNLSDPGKTYTTPVNTVEGDAPTPKPHWSCESTPSRIITDASEVLVSVDVEVKRFHVAVRMGAQGLAVKVTDGGTRRIRAAVAAAGEGAYHVFDYADWNNAVIMKPSKQTPLVEWRNQTAQAAIYARQGVNDQH